MPRACFLNLDLWWPENPLSSAIPVAETVIADIDRALGTGRCGRCWENSTIYL